MVNVLASVDASDIVFCLDVMSAIDGFGRTHICYTAPLYITRPEVEQV